MADVLDSAKTVRPDAKIFRRAGLTQREADRLANSEHARSETRSVWKASLIGLFFWGLWKCLYKGFQPLWILASLALSAWFAAQIVIQSGGISALSDPELSLDRRVELAVAARIPSDTDGRTFWYARMDDALDGDYRHRPDIDLFRVWAAMGPDLIGRESLALESIAHQQNRNSLQTDAFTQPVWDREAALNAAFQSRMGEGIRRDLYPVQLIFAPEAFQDRHDASLFAWAIAHSRANEFFLGQSRGQLELTSLPGFVRREQAGTRLYGGVRHLIIQACAYHASLTESPDDCQSSIIPVYPFSAVQFRLSALEAGMVRLPIPASAVQDSAEVLTMAMAAGRIHPDLSSEIEVWLEDILPEDLISLELTRSGLRMDMAFAGPRRASQSLNSMIIPAHSDSAVALAQFLESVSNIRRTTSPTQTVRLLEGVKNSDQMESLQQLLSLFEERLPGLQLILGDEIYELLREEPPNPHPEDRMIQGLYAGLISAAMVLLLSMIRLSTPVLVRRASRLKSIDASLSRLFLGRKS